MLHHCFSIGTLPRLYVLRPLYAAQTIWAGSCVDVFTLGFKQREKTSVATRTGDSYFFVIFFCFFSAVLVIVKTSAPWVIRSVDPEVKTVTNFEMMLLLWRINKHLNKMEESNIKMFTTGPKDICLCFQKRHMIGSNLHK